MFLRSAIWLVDRTRSVRQRRIAGITFLIGTNAPALNPRSGAGGCTYSDPGMSAITVYSTDPCSFCTRVKGLLAARGLEFTEVNLSKDPAGRMELVSKTGMMSFPQVLVGDQLVGGFSELEAAVEDGRLERMLSA
jgi:glutaredoxin 3